MDGSAAKIDLPDPVSSPVSQTDVNHVLDGALIYTRPKSLKPKIRRRHSEGVEWAKKFLIEESLPVKKTLLEPTQPHDWVLYYSAKRGWFKIYIGMFFE